MRSDWRVVLTRPTEQSLPLERELRGLGFRTTLLPAIAIEPIEPTSAARELCGRALHGEFSWVLFTSANGVRFFATLLESVNPEAKLPEPTAFGAIGGASADEIARVFRVPAAYVAADGTSAGLGSELASGFEMKGERVLVPGPEEGRSELREVLSAAGAIVTELPLYRTVAARLPHAATLQKLCPAAEAERTIVTFFSPSAVRSLWNAEFLRPVLAKSRIVTIGPVTSTAVRDLGLEVWGEADQPSDREVIDLVCARCT